MRTFWNFNGGIKHIDAWEPNCWVQITCPDDDDKEFIEKELGMPDYFMEDVSDADERARYDMDEGWLMIILRIPHLKSVSSRSPYTTIPLGIVIKGDKIITICYQETRMMLNFVNHQMRRAEGFTDAADLVFRLFLSASVWYLKYLKQVNAIGIPLRAGKQTERSGFEVDVFQNRNTYPRNLLHAQVNVFHFHQ